MDNEIIKHALHLAGYGMLGVFIFMTLFYLLIRILSRLYPHKGNEENVSSDQ